jgi:hypothetical protein
MTLLDGIIVFFHSFMCKKKQIYIALVLIKMRRMFLRTKLVKKKIKYKLLFLKSIS